MDNCKALSTPVDVAQSLSADIGPKSEADIEDMKKVPYLEAIGCLLYAAQNTRPGKSSAVNMLSRFSSNPEMVHWTAVKLTNDLPAVTIQENSNYMMNEASKERGICQSTYNIDAVHHQHNRQQKNVDQTLSVATLDEQPVNKGSKINLEQKPQVIKHPGPHQHPIGMENSQHAHARQGEIDVLNCNKQPYQEQYQSCTKYYDSLKVEAICHLPQHQAQSRCIFAPNHLEEGRAAHTQQPTSSTATLTIQGSFQNVLNLHRQQNAAAFSAQQQDSERPQTQYTKHQLPVQLSTVTVSTSLAINRHTDSAHDFHQSAATSASTSSSGKSQVRVCINRLNVEDARLMQQSIEKFVQKSPELAKNMGLLQEHQRPNEISKFSHSSKDIEETRRFLCTDEPRKNAKTSVDMFTVIKADEKRTCTKRKVAVSLGDIPPEQIFSKPKLRRVERIMPLTTTKCTKEEVTRSQTYQQFMRNMEQIIELLDDTESPNFDSALKSLLLE
ncbi:uncharacterized protein Dwil_GK27305 [Drosophila willistoni]|uniref:Uncharacterized protein n=1 Tax=Drosophila willistoni TaxID=7260 RepID=A0A0Q9WWB8_DROWI|nr:uncharacterized protein Dwil_GK27305 [Drosophila willistoni]